MNNEILEMLKKMDSRLDKIESRLDTLEANVKYIKVGQDEHSKLLEAIINRSDVHSAEIKKLNTKVDKISESIESLRSDLDFVEQVTGKNLFDIEKLKTIK